MSNDVYYDFYRTSFVVGKETVLLTSFPPHTKSGKEIPGSTRHCTSRHCCSTTSKKKNVWKTQRFHFGTRKVVGTEAVQSSLWPKKLVQKEEERGATSKELSATGNRGKVPFFIFHIRVKGRSSVCASVKKG